MHFTVLVIGENPEKQLAPFDESLKLEFKDTAEEYREEYETRIVNEFYCSSCSSWGFEITKELFEELEKSKVGRVIFYEVQKLNSLDYLKLNKKYRGYYTLENGKRCEGDQWFEVEEILSTTDPDKDTCFEGKVRLRKISPPMQIALKDKYPIYEDYLKAWHDIDDINQQGYDFNPQAKWDWYQLGGRWTGFFILKPHAKGVVGDYSLVSDRRAKFGTADQAYKKDIDFDAMRQDAFEISSKNYDEFEKARQSENFDPTTAYFKYGVENTSEKSEEYIPQTREEYIKKNSHITTFAILKDGKWEERGWESNEKSDEIWYQKFYKLLDELPDDTLLSVFDCHI